jgi:predicted DNA-binding protein
MKTQTEKKRLVRLELGGPAHARLRVLAAERGLPMSQYVREIVEREIAKKDGKKAEK